MTRARQEICLGTLYSTISDELPRAESTCLILQLLLKLELLIRTPPKLNGYLVQVESNIMNMPIPCIMTTYASNSSISLFVSPSKYARSSMLSPALSLAGASS
jgi:hypothetical protein